jgi:hypothetical protein
VVVPAALMISLAVLALGGGSLSLASLKQLVSGPAAPSGQPVALGAPSASTLGRRSGRGPAASALLASTTTPGAGTHLTGAGSRSSHHTGRGPGHGQAPGGGGGGGGSGGGGGGGGSEGGGGGGGGGGAPHPRHQTVVDRVVNTVTPVTSQLPSPAGPIVTQAVKSAGSVADQLLHKLPPK